MYLTVDGGGSKLAAACFTEDFTVVARGRSGGVNTTQNRPESVREHVEECLAQVLRGVEAIDEALVVFVGPRDLFAQALQNHVRVGRITFFDESHAALMAGSGREEGLLALSGTGSDVFYIRPGETMRVGGWGPVLGDQGSGTWIGLQAARAAVRELNEWGEKTLLTPLILRHFGAEADSWNIVRRVYGQNAPFPEMARLTPLCAQAAREGDEVALRIFSEAGRLMGVQMNTLLGGLKDVSPRDVTLCGGAWKAHERMLEAFEEELHRLRPDMRVHRPWFEHMAAGPMHLLRKQGYSPIEARRRVAQAFEMEIISREEWT